MEEEQKKKERHSWKVSWQASQLSSRKKLAGSSFSFLGILKLVTKRKKNRVTNSEPMLVGASTNNAHPKHLVCEMKRGHL